MRMDASSMAALQEATVQRLAATELERTATRQYLQQGEVRKADTAPRVERRKLRLLADPSMTPLLGSANRDALASGPVSEAPEEAQLAFEVAINGNDAQPGWFLARGAEIRRTVGRIHIRDAVRRVGWGTGFLVAPRLLLTNQHVLDSLETARYSRVEFDYEETYLGEVLSSAWFDLDPDTFFVSSPARGGMDYALVAVASATRSDSGRPAATLAEFGHNILVRQEGKLLKGELINAIHHPEGQPRQVSLRENRLMALQSPALEDRWMHYETDTDKGSSGAPLFNNQWEVVGLHHMAVEKRDAAGNILAIGGSRWTPSMGEREKWWYANEGLRISRFIADVEEQLQAFLTGTSSLRPSHVVSDAGQSLFAALLQPSQQPTEPASPVITTARPPSRPPVATPEFHPE